MSRLYKQVFAAAVAAAALVAYMQSPGAQEAKKEKPALQKHDTKMMRDIAQADLAEVQAGRLAARKAASAEVKKFGQHMVDDHGKHLSEARAMAKTKGLQLPSAPAKKHQQAMKNLESASGAEFDKAFMQQMVKDHEDALKLVQDTAKNAKDAQLKADAEKTAPVIQKHLDEAKRIAASLK